MRMLRHDYYRFSLVKTASLLLLLGLLPLAAAAQSVPLLWGIDEDDGQLFTLENYTECNLDSDAAGFTDYGRMKWNDDGTIRNIGNELESMTLDKDGTMYMMVNKDFAGFDAQVLVSFNIADARVGENNVVTVIGSSGLKGGLINGLSIHPTTGVLYGVWDKDGNDELVTIDKATGEATKVGKIKDGGTKADDSEDMEFDADGNLYVTDNKDDELYRVDPSNGKILEVVDDDQKDGLGVSSVKFEALGWDFINGRLVGMDDNNELVAHLTLEDGNNVKYCKDSDVLTDVEGIDFVPAIIDLELDQSVNDTNPDVGESVTFTVTLTNQGPDRATGVKVTHLLSDGLTFTGSGTSQGSFDDDVWTVGTLESGQTVTLTITATANGSDAAVASAEVTSAVQPDRDSTPGNNDLGEDDQDIDVLNVPGGTCSVTAMSDCITVELVETSTSRGQTTYTFEVTNACKNAISHASFELPSGTTAISPDDNSTVRGDIASYNIENTTNNPFYSIKFETIGEGAKDGQTETFSFTVGTELDDPFQVEVKYGRNRDFFALNNSCATATIGDLVWEDTDGDGTRDDGEPGLDGVTVELLQGGSQVATTTTDEGAYRFTDLAAGTYAVRVVERTLPAGYTLTTGDATITVSLDQGEDFDDADFGYEPPPAPTNSIGDLVFKDFNGDGTLNGSDVGLAGVTVNLTDLGSDNACDTGDENSLGSQTTGDDGAYNFVDLADGTYCVVLDENTVPDDYLFTTGTNPFRVEVSGGEDFDDADFGYQPPQGSIGDFVYEDTNGNGSADRGEPGYENIEVNLIDPGNNGVCEGGDTVLDTETTDRSGRYDFTGLAAGTYCVTVVGTNLPDDVQLTTGNNPLVVTIEQDEDYDRADFGYQPPIGSIGDRVFTDANGDAQQQDGETGIANVDLTLSTIGGDDTCGTGDDTEVATATTDARGAYLFDDLAQGTYCVDVDGTTVPDGFTLTTDNDPLRVGLGHAENYEQADFGYQPADDSAGSIGDLVYSDPNRDGVFQNGEAGIQGVPVILSTPTNDTCGDEDDVPVDTTVTDASGNYRFTGLLPGTYCVQADGSDLGEGFESTSDNPLTVTLASGEDVDTADFGFVPPPADLEVTKTVNDPTPAPEDEILFTITLTNDGPYDATNIVVRDQLAFGFTFVEAEATGGDYDALTGFWSLDELISGRTDTLYITAKVEASIDGFFQENIAQVIFVDQRDPDSTPANGVPEEDDQDNAIVYVGGSFPGSGTADLSVTKEVDSSSPAINENVTFTIRTSNAGPDAATGLVVRDILPYGLSFVEANPDVGEYDPATGFWTIGELGVDETAKLELTVQVIVINALENIAQVIFVDQDDPDSEPSNGVPEEDDQDRALVEARAGLGSAGILRPECTDLSTINVMAYDSDNDILYAGTEAGDVYVSNDNGENWPPFLSTDGAPIRDLVFGGSTIYAATFGEGVYRSTDQGTTWTSMGPADGNATALVYVGNVLYAALEGRVAFYDGSAWQTLGDTAPFEGRQLNALNYDAASNIGFAAVPELGVFRYESGNWVAANTGLPTGRINGLTFGPDGASLAATNADGVYTFDGTQWERLGTGLEGEPIQTIRTAFDGQILVGTRERGFFVWDADNERWNNVPNLPTYTVRAVTKDDDGDYYVGTTGDGIFRYSDEQWFHVTSFLTDATILGLVVAPDGAMYAATYGFGVLLSEDGGQCWTRINRGLYNLWTFAITRTNSGALYIGVWADGLGGVWRSTDDGRNWDFLGLGDRQVVAVAVDPSDDNTIYAGTNLEGRGSIFRSTDGGENWEQLDTFTHPVWAIAIDASDSDVITIGTRGSGVLRSTDGAQTFNLIGTMGNGMGSDQVFELRYAPASSPRAGELFAGTADGVYVYDEANNVWSSFGLSGEEVRTLEFAGDQMYAGTWGSGVFVFDLTDDGGIAQHTGTTAHERAGWESFGLGGNTVPAMQFDPARDALVFGTDGDGVFLAPEVTGTAIDDEPEVPSGFALHQNYPNPFNPRTTINVEVPQTAKVTLTLYDVLGRRVAILHDGPLAAGTHAVLFDGSRLASGTYFYRLQTPNGLFVKQMVLVK